jgi:hypothetical protein
MSELYHAKKKKKGISSVVNNLENIDRGIGKAKSIGKHAQEGYKDSSSPKGLPTLPNKSHSTGKLANYANSVQNKADTLATNAKTNKAKVSYTSAKPVFNNYDDEEDNPPKNLRRRLNHVKLKSIVGPKDRKFYGEEGLDSAQSENKRAQQYRYTDWVAQPMPTSPGGTKHRRSKGR